MAPTEEVMGDSLHTKLRGDPVGARCPPSRRWCRRRQRPARGRRPGPTRSPRPAGWGPRPAPRAGPGHACSSSRVSSTPAEPNHETPDEARARRAPRGGGDTRRTPWPGSAGGGGGRPTGLQCPRATEARPQLRRLRSTSRLPGSPLGGAGSEARGVPLAPLPVPTPPEPRRWSHCPGTARGCDLRVRVPAPGTGTPPGAPRASPGTSAAES